MSDPQNANCPEQDSDQDCVKEPLLVPARMVNEYVYCPRLAYIEWVEGEFRDNFFTVDGRYQHRRVDQPGPALPKSEDQSTTCNDNHQARIAPDALAPHVSCDKEGIVTEPEEKKTTTIHARSVHLSAPRAGLIARIDLVQADGRVATPVDYKRGKPPKRPEGAYDAERVQICAQAIVLEENGYLCTEGVLYFAGARKRVTIPITDELRQQTLDAASKLRELKRQTVAPAPLVDSPKCHGCSLSPICLPDEINSVSERIEGRVRRLFPSNNDALPLHVQEHGARLGFAKGMLCITHRDGTRREVRLREVSHVAIYGNAQVSTQAIRTLADNGVPIIYYTPGGRFCALVQSLSHQNVLLRRQQFAAASDTTRCLAIAKSLISQKIRNQRTLLRRNKRIDLTSELRDLRTMARRSEDAQCAESLLGIEGTAARTYFGGFSSMLAGGTMRDFDMKGRNRRPPRDPINALLSFAYALLLKDITLAISAVGLDSCMGFYHRVRAGRPSLALDLMEPFRPIIADSVVINAVNNGVVSTRDFLISAGGVLLREAGRRRFIGVYERRLGEIVKHPVFQYRISYRRVLEVQVRLLARYLTGEVQEVPSFTTR